MANLKKARIVDVSAAFEGLSRHTRQTYEYQFGLYMQYARTLQEAMNPQTLSSYRQRIIESGKEAVSTIHVRMMAIRRVAEWMYDNGNLTRTHLLELRDVKSPSKKSMRHRASSRKRPRITPEKMREICDLPEASVMNPVPTRDRALLLTLATTGARADEIALIKTEDVVRVGDGYMIRNVDGRSIPINEEVYSAIQDWLYVRPIKSPYVFSRAVVYPTGNIFWHDLPMGREGAERVVRLYSSMAGVEDLRLGDLRRFVAEQVAARDGISAAQRMLGHKSILSTAQAIAEEVTTISPITF